MQRGCPKLRIVQTFLLNGAVASNLLIFIVLVTVMESAMVINNKSAEILDALIIDDEKDICYLLNGILRQRMHSVQFVNSLSEAKTAMKVDAPDILFLDNHLPDGYGMDFMRYVKTEFPSTKVIMITAHDSQQDRAKAFVEGVDFFISKPFTRAQINEAIDKLKVA
jgi:two-component system, OmpR family, response regulator